MRIKTAQQLITYDGRTGVIKRLDGKHFTMFYKNKIPYTCIGGANVPVLKLIWEYVYGALDKYESVYFLTDNRNDYRLFNLVCPGNPNYLAASKVNRYLNMLQRKHDEELGLAGTFAKFDK